MLAVIRVHCTNSCLTFGQYDYDVTCMESPFALFEEAVQSGHLELVEGAVGQRQRVAGLGQRGRPIHHWRWGRRHASLHACHAMFKACSFLPLHITCLPYPLHGRMSKGYGKGIYLTPKAAYTCMLFLFMHSFMPSASGKLSIAIWLS